MHRAIVAILTLPAGLALGQEALVQRSAIRADVVRRGDLIQMARGLGEIKAERTVELKIPESITQGIAAGQESVIDTRRGTQNGRVVRVTPAGADGMARVDVALDQTPPPDVRPGLTVDGTIHLLTLKDVLCVGGPSDELSALSDRSRTMFRLDADGRHAVKVQVEFGLTGRSPREPSFDKVIEIRSGLRPGDTLILSDMTAFTEKERVRIQ